MTVKAVLVYPKKELREVAQVVAESELNSEEVVNLCQDLKDTMAAYEADGVAATQIGVLKRVIVIKENDQPLIIINPEIVDSSGVL
jgi:peptide deformylase